MHLVTSPIHHFTADGITTNDGKHYKVNTVIYGTGFKGAEFLAPMKIYSRNGVDLNKIWDNGIYAYLGATIPTFPNFLYYLDPILF